MHQEFHKIDRHLDIVDSWSKCDNGTLTVVSNVSGIEVVSHLDTIARDCHIALGQAIAMPDPNIGRYDVGPKRGPVLVCMVEQSRYLEPLAQRGSVSSQEGPVAFREPYTQAFLSPRDHLFARRASNGALVEKTRYVLEVRHLFFLEPSLLDHIGWHVASLNRILQALPPIAR